MAPEERLMQLASRLSDGEVVDWHAARRATSDPEERETLRFLEMVAGLVNAHRTLHSTADHAADTTIAADPRPAAAVAAPVHTARWGRLELRGLLGSGSFGEVHRAWDPDLGREVALKLLHPGRERGGADTVLAEGRMLARLRHPNVVVAHGAERHDGRVGIWMELVRGRTLADLTREQGTSGAREAALVGLELCKALTAVHQAGLVHRDINTRNVMRAEGGRIVLMDFGTGREARDADAATAGTPYFMAPEVLRGEPATVRSDIYSLGAVLFHLVTGSYPVRGESMQVVRDVHERGGATLLREARADLQEPFVRVVERALAADPAARWASAGQMEQALANALGVEAAEPQRVERRPARWSWALVVGVPVAALILLAVILQGRDTTVPHTDDGASSGPTTSAPPAVVPLEVRTTFTRLRGGKREPLEDGGRVAPGDGIGLEMRTNQPVHAYVVTQDEQGRAHLLFPLPGFEPTNPLAAGERHQLPGTRDRVGFDWQVDTAGGREQLLVIVSRERLAELEADLLALQQPAPGGGPQYAELSSGAVERLRGIGGLVERPGTEPPAPARQSQLDAIASKLHAGVETTPGIWVRRVTFENPVQP